MEKYEETVQKWLEIKEYKNDPNVIAIWEYGSRVHGTQTIDSDIDILVITNKGIDSRGCNLIDGIPIEYFVKTITQIISDIQLDCKRNDGVHLSMFEQGRLLYGNKEVIEFVRDNIKKATSLPIQPYSLTELEKSQLIRLQNELKMVNPYSPIFNSLYYTYFDMVRNLYHKENHYSNFKPQKVPTLYTDDEKAKNYFVKLPDISFRGWFLTAIKDSNTLEQKQFYMEQIFEKNPYDEITVSDKEMRLPKIYNAQSRYISLWNRIKYIIRPSIFTDYQYYTLLEDMHIFYNQLTDNMQPFSITDDFETKNEDWRWDSNYRVALESTELEDREAVLNFLFEALQNHMNESDIVHPLNYEIQYTKK